LWTTTGPLRRAIRAALCSHFVALHRVEKELQKDLPPSFAADMDETLLLHWVEELENFFERLDKFLVQVVWDEFVIKPDDGAEEFELLQVRKRERLGAVHC